jgi:hypothetical protein
VIGLAGVSVQLFLLWALFCKPAWTGCMLRCLMPDVALRPHSKADLDSVGFDMMVLQDH